MSTPEHQIFNVANSALYPYVRKILSLYRPMSVDGGHLVRKGRDYDGGYIMLDSRLGESICYSLGIGDDVSWDLDMAALGCHIYQYDHTIEAFPVNHSLFHSHKIGICPQASEDPQLKTIDELLLSNGHRKSRNLILKMDIEGHEWRAFEFLPPDALDCFSQMIVEMHGFAHVNDTNHVRRYIRVLEKLSRTHQVIHIHANNCGPATVVAGILLPDTFEVTFVRRTDQNFSECHKIFPTALDMPCDLAKADYFLGAMGLY